MIKHKGENGCLKLEKCYIRAILEKDRLILVKTPDLSVYLELYLDNDNQIKDLIKALKKDKRVTIKHKEKV